MGTPPPAPPPIRGGRGYFRLSPEAAGRAIDTVKAALPYVTVTVLARRGPAGDFCVDVALMYHDFALDRVHFDPESVAPSPKGRPVCLWGEGAVDQKAVKDAMVEFLKEFRVLDAVEFREPERAWVVPLAWRNYIVAHVRVSVDGSELVPDYGLTEEVHRFFA